MSNPAEIQKENDKTEQTGDYHSFCFRSTGLGKQILYGEPLEIVIVEDMMIMKVQTTEPVQWVIRAGLTYRALIKSAILALKRPAVIKFLLFGWITIKKPKISTDF